MELLYLFVKKNKKNYSSNRLLMRKSMITKKFEKRLPHFFQIKFHQLKE